jgi:hypothetical protein
LWVEDWRAKCQHCPAHSRAQTDFQGLANQNPGSITMLKGVMAFDVPGPVRT